MDFKQFSTSFYTKILATVCSGFEPNSLIINTNACTTRPLVSACMERGKSLTLNSFLLHFKQKYLQLSPAGFEPN